MSSLSEFYIAIANRNYESFKKTLIFLTFIILALTVFKVFKAYYCEMCYNSWRQLLTEKSIDEIFFNDIQSKNRIMYEIKLDNVDQRITQDVDKLSKHLSNLFERLVIVPLVIIYYTLYLFFLLGWIVPAMCFINFLFGVVISGLIASKIISLVYRQESLEGEFRKSTYSYFGNFETIFLYNGQSYERNKIISNFHNAIFNRYKMININFWLNLFLFFYEYWGSIGNKEIIYP